VRRLRLPLGVAKSTIVLDDEEEAKLKGLFKDAARTADALWRQKDVLTKAEIDDLFNESNRLIGSRANLLIAAIKQKPGELRIRKPALVPPTAHPTPEHGDAPTATQPQSAICQGCFRGFRGRVNISKLKSICTAPRYYGHAATALRPRVLRIYNVR
jgi:hypothetical protein